MKQYKIITRNNLDKELYNEWLGLWKKSSCANYINGPQWFTSSVDTFKYRDHCIICIYKADKLVGVSALIKSKLYGLKIWTILPSDYALGIPFLTSNLDRDKIIKLLLKEVSSLGIVILDNISEDLIHYFKKDSKYSFSHQALNFYLNIKYDSKGQVIVHGRNKLIKEARKIEDKYSIESYDGNNNKVLNLIYKIDNKSRKHDHHYNTFTDKKIQEFYNKLANNFKENFLMSILYFKNIAVAYEIGFMVNDLYTGSQVAFDNKYSKYTPGKVSELKVIDLMAKKGVKCIDYGSGDSYIKRLISDEYRNLYKIIISNNKVIHLYLNIIFKLKNKLYKFLYENKFIYSIYRKLRYT